MKRFVFYFNFVFALMLFSASAGFGQCDAGFTYVVDCNEVTLTPDTILPNCIYNWNYGIGVSDDPITTFTYDIPGNDTIMLSIMLNVECDNGNVSCESTENIEVYQIPDGSIVPVFPPDSWVNCIDDPNTDFFNLVVANASMSADTDSIIYIDWGYLLDSSQNEIDTIFAPFTGFPWHTYPDLQTFPITVTTIGQNGCVSINNYTFINSSASPSIGLELDGQTNECVGYVGAFVVSNTEDNPSNTRYEFIASNGMGFDTLTFFHPPPDTIHYTFENASCGDTCTIASVVYPNSFCVSITAYVDECGASSSAAVGPIRIDEGPTADFERNPDAFQCVGDVYDFVNTSIPGDYNVIGTPNCSDSTHYFWSVTGPSDEYTVVYGELGDPGEFPNPPEPGSADSVGIVFDDPGTYTICLVAESVFSQVCDTDTICKSICVLPDPIADFSANALIGCAPLPVTLTNLSNTLESCEEAEYEWSATFIESECELDTTFMFTTPTDTTDAAILFNNPGNYLVQLRVVNRCDTSYTEQMITVGNPPIVEIDTIPDACVSTVINPTFETLTDCYAAPDSIVWCFPGSSNPVLDTVVLDDINDPLPSIFYGEVGTYVITVKVYNECGLTIDTELLNVFPLPEIPDIGITTPICSGEDLCFTVTNLGPNEIIEWQGPQGWTSNELNICIENASVLDSGLYELTILDTLTTCVNDTFVNVIVHALPNVNITPDSIGVCAGQSETLVASALNSTFQWFPSQYLDVSTGPVVVTTPGDSITYFVVATDTLTGCQNTDSVIVNVNELPIVSGGPDTVTCDGTNLQLIGSPNMPGIFFWTDDDGDISSTGLYNGEPGQDTVTYHYIDEFGCEDSSIVAICVLNIPDASFTLDTTMGCGPLLVSPTNTSSTINDCEEASYLWTVIFVEADCHMDSTGWQFVNGNANSIAPDILFSRSGEYTIQLQVANRCDTSFFSQNVIIGEAPTAEIIVETVLCNEFSVFPVGDADDCNSGNISYNWSSPDVISIEFPNSLVPGEVVFPNMPGTYTLVFTDSTVCGVTSTQATIQIFDLPFVEANNDTPVCEGESIQLFSNAPTADSLVWTGPLNFFSNEPNPIINNAVLGNAGTYTLTVFDNNSCSNTDTTEVVVLANPDVQAFPEVDTLLCFGDVITLSVNGNADEYNWSPATGLNTTMGTSVQANPVVTTTYVVEGIDTLTGCSDFDTITVIVEPLPIVDAGPDTFVCANNNLQLGGTPQPGLWYDENGDLIPNGIYNQSFPGVYTLTYEHEVDTTGCTNFDTLDVCVLSNPISSFDLDTLLGCVGTQISATNTSNVLSDCQMATFEWSVQLDTAECHSDTTGWFFASGGPNTADATFGFTLSGRYIISLTVTNACGTVTTSQIVEIGEAPDVTIDPLPLLCAEFSVFPIATIAFCNSAQDSVLWSFPGAVSPPSSNQIIPGMVTYPGPGTYTISLEVTNACGTTTDNYTFEIFDLPSVVASNNSPLCEGAELQLFADAPAGISFTWLGPDGTIYDGPVVVIPNATTDHAGTYTVTVTDANGCVNTDTTNVTVFELPMLEIAAMPEVICEGESTILTASGADVYEWPQLGESSSLVTVSPTSDMDYIVIGTDTITGCVNTDTITIQVNPLPIVDAGPDTFVCASAPLVLGGDPEPGIWTDENGTVIANGIYIQPTPGEYTLYYTHEDSVDCVNQDSMVVCVLSNPISSFDLNTIIGCVGNQVMATNTSNVIGDCEPAEYSWDVQLDTAYCHMDSTGWFFAVGGPNTQDVTIEFTLSGIYIISLTVTNECGAVTTSQTVEIGDAPDIEMVPFADVCDVYSFQPMAIVSDCNNDLIGTYQWSFPGADIPSSTSTIPPIITYPGPGVYSITLSVSNDCGTTTETYTFEVFALPSASADNNGPVCEFDQIILDGEAVSFDSVLWVGPNGFESNILDPIITPVTLADAGLYTLMVWDNGCLNMDTTTVVVLELPELTFTTDNEICIGDSVVIEVAGADHYTWAADPSLNITSGSVVVANPVVNTTYYVTGIIDSTGCTNTDSIQIIVNPLPVVEAGPPVTACAFMGEQLIGSPIGGVWSGNIEPNGFFIEDESGEYTVVYTYTDANGCTNSDSTVVCVINTPDAGFTVNNASGCVPFTVDFTNTSGTLSDCEVANYEWIITFIGADCHANDDGWMFVNGTSSSTPDASIEFEESGEYLVELIVTNSCGVSSVATTITVAEPPNVEIQPQPNLCAVFTVDPALMTDLSCNGTITSYDWSFGPDATPAVFSGPDPGPVSFNASGFKTITVIATNECGSTTHSIDFQISDLPVVEATAVMDSLCVGDDLFLQAIGDPGLEYVWTGPSGFTSTEQNPVINTVTPGNAGAYTVTATDPDTECTFSDEVIIVINPLPVVSAGPDLIACLEDGPVTLAGTPAGGTWDLAPGGVFTPVNSGTFILTYTFTDINGCTNSDNLAIIVPPAAIVESYADSLCIDEFVVINGNLYNVDNPTGTEVFVSASTGCDSLVLNISLGFWDVDMITSTVDPSCFGDEDGMIIVEDVDGGTPPYTYSLNGGSDAPIFQLPFEILNLGAGLYSLTVTDAEGCEVTDNGIELYDPTELTVILPSDTTITQGDQLEINAEIIPAVFDPVVIWSPPVGDIGCDSCASPIVQPLITTTYTATYINEFGCLASDDITIIVEEELNVFVPNAFSPNDDGYNDKFRPYVNEKQVTGIREFSIFDRWGEQLYYCGNKGTVDSSIDACEWDGTFNGKQMDPQVCVWYLEVTKIDGTTEIMKGDVVILR